MSCVCILSMMGFIFCFIGFIMYTIAFCPACSGCPAPYSDTSPHGETTVMVAHIIAYIWVIFSTPLFTFPLCCPICRISCGLFFALALMLFLAMVLGIVAVAV